MWLTGLSSGLVLEKAQVRKKESSPEQAQNNLEGGVLGSVADPDP